MLDAVYIINCYLKLLDKTETVRLKEAAAGFSTVDLQTKYLIPPGQNIT